MQKHILVTLAVCCLLEEPRASTLDLDTAASLVLNVLHVGAAMANDLGPEVETWNGLEVDWDFRLRPFALPMVSAIHAVVENAQREDTLPNSSRSKFSGSRRRKRRSSTSFGSSCFLSSSIMATAFSRPSLLVLVTCK